ncbi:DinB family protein [Planococcus salinus]|uniref:DinB family protein n=1 Tax=Planococcus salinus TaxID=1848460 RepID=UPI001314E6ED|nr:DinB family protein [Planococcus salinus]
MERERVLEAFRDYEMYLASLRTSIKNDEDAREPIAEGKWSIAEIILHLAEWDRFIREERLPFIRSGKAFASYPEVDDFNRRAVTKVDELKFPDILAHAQKRRALVGKEIEKLEPHEWSAPFTIGDSKVSFASYFEGIVEHDRHHIRQIDSFLTEKKQRS